MDGKERKHYYLEVKSSRSHKPAPAYFSMNETKFLFWNNTHNAKDKYRILRVNDVETNHPTIKKIKNISEQLVNGGLEIMSLSIKI